MITILMAAFNGEAYIGEQIESILSQTYTGWRLIIQDDCSTDHTAIIARKYAAMFPGKISFIQRPFPSGSAKNNFSELLALVDSEYFFTSDDDDVWLPDKIEISLNKMIELEKQVGKTRPLLVHTDLEVVDRHLQTLSSSMFHRQSLDSNRNQFHHYLVQNNVTGCTMMGNRALLAYSRALPPQAIMHDWWLALIAAAFGNVGFVNECTVLYRQHDHNEVGAKKAKSVLYNLQRLIKATSSQKALLKTYEQARAFLDIHGESLGAEKVETIQAYLSIPKKKKLERILLLHKYDFWKSGFYRKCGQFLFV